MNDRNRAARIAALALVLALAMAAPGDGRGQFAARYPSLSQLGSGYGAAGSGTAYPSPGYGIRTGQVGLGFGSGYGIYRGGFSVPRAQTTVALQPLYSAITSLPGWSGPTGHVSRRVHHARRRSLDPPIPHYDRKGNILWPGILRDDSTPTATALRRAADDAFRAVYHESKTTGHASIRPVIAAKAKLSAYERKVLPAIKDRSAPDGDALEAFFVDLDRSLDEMNAVF